MKTSLLFCTLFQCFWGFSQLEWVTYTPAMESYNSITCESMIADPFGNTYTCGSFYGTIDFDPGPTNDSRIAQNNWDVYVRKLDSDGNMVWTVTLGGASEDRGLGIAIDQNQNILITGSFQDTADLDPGIGSYELTAPDFSSIGFVVKLNSGGNFIWAKPFESTVGTIAYKAIFTTGSDCLIYGKFSIDVDLDPGPAVVSHVNNSGGGAFIVKLDEDGNFILGKSLFGSIAINDIDVVQDGGFAIIGEFGSTIDLDPDIGIHSVTPNNSGDIFLLKLNSLGEFDWARTYGSKSNDYGAAVKVSSQGDYYLTGRYSDTIDFNPSGAPEVLLASYGNIFILKLNSQGNFQWVKRIDGDENSPERMIIDQNDNIILGGLFSAHVSFNIGSSETTFDSPWNSDAFVLGLNSTGDFNWVFTIPSTQVSRIGGLAKDSNGNLYASGVFFGTTDFAPGQDVYEIPAPPYDPSIYTFKLNSTLSTKDIFAMTNYSIFPNPVTNTLSVYSDTDKTESIDIYLPTGVKVLSSLYSDLLDVSELCAGTYILVRNSEKENSKLFIKE